MDESNHPCLSIRAQWGCQHSHGVEGRAAAPPLIPAAVLHADLELPERPLSGPQHYCRAARRADY